MFKYVLNESRKSVPSKYVGGLKRNISKSERILFKNTKMKLKLLLNCFFFSSIADRFLVVYDLLP